MMVGLVVQESAPRVFLRTWAAIDLIRVVTVIPVVDADRDVALW